jgi:hypothetical protein
MLRAAQVGLGWWGKTLVESVQGTSDVIQFVAAVSRRQPDDHQRFAAAQGLRLYATYEAALADPQVDAVVLATPHSLHSAQVIAAAQAKKHVFCEKPFALTKADAEAAVSATRHAQVTLGLGYNRRFHPEMTRLRDQIRSGALGTILHVEATMTFPNGLFLTPDAWRADTHETPCGALTPMGVHAIDGMIDLCGPIPPRGRGRRRRHDVDAVSDGGRDVGVSRDDDGDGARLQLPGVWLDGLGPARRDDARRRRVERGAPHQIIWPLCVSADQGRGGHLGSGAAGRHARVSRGVCHRRAGRPGVSDSARRDDPRRGGDRSRRALGRDGPDSTDCVTTYTAEHAKHAENIFIKRKHLSGRR